MSNFEKQQTIFNEFIENTKDRFDLIIKDGVNLIFDENFIQFDNLLRIRIHKNNLLPEIIFMNSIKTPDDFKMTKNIIESFDEICSILREYVTMYYHLNNNFCDKSLSTDENYKICLAAIKEIELNNPQLLNEKIYFITKNEMDVKFYLSIDCYGGAKKRDVDISYIAIDDEYQPIVIGSYKIDKNDFASDVAYQLANNVCSHLNK